MTTILKAEAAVYGGYSIAREDGVIFIKGAIPGEVVEVSVIEKKRDYSVAAVKEILEPSDHRVDPPCAYFGECGGCQIQYISYNKQVSLKNDILLDSLRHIGKLEITPEQSLSSEPFGYRHRGQFKVNAKEGAIGFYRAGTREVVSVDRCPLMTDGIISQYSKLRGVDISGIGELHITSGDSPMVLIKGTGYEEAIAERFAGLGFSGVAFDDYSYQYNGHVTFDLDGLSYTISPWSFFQSNWGLNLIVTHIIEDGLEPLEGKRVLDMFAGAGNFSLKLAGKAKEVVAIEYNQSSIKDGKRNVAINNIDNYTFIEGSAETAKLKGTFDTVLLNPPRPGLTNIALQRVLEISPEKIAYISCNPSTLARDLGKLSNSYTIDSVRMIDFFPNTYHIESITFLTRKPSS